jgi:hypothetical protein
MSVLPKRLNWGQQGGFTRWVDPRGYSGDRKRKYRGDSRGGYDAWRVEALGRRKLRQQRDKTYRDGQPYKAAESSQECALYEKLRQDVAVGGA